MCSCIDSHLPGLATSTLHFTTIVLVMVGVSTLAIHKLPTVCIRMPAYPCKLLLSVQYACAKSSAALNAVEQLNCTTQEQTCSRQNIPATRGTADPAAQPAAYGSIPDICLMIWVTGELRQAGSLARAAMPLWLQQVCARHAGWTRPSPSQQVSRCQHTSLPVARPPDPACRGGELAGLGAQQELQACRCRSGQGLTGWFILRQ